MIKDLQEEQNAKMMEALKEIPVSEWARIHNTFNHWIFPEDLIKFKPDWWNDSEGGYADSISNKKQKIINPINNYIWEHIGTYEILKEHNVTGKLKGGDMMTLEEYNKWYHKWHS